MKQIKRVFNFISNAIFYFIVTVIVVVLLLAACGIKPYITISGSMEPSIQTGSVCFVNTKAEYDEIQEGDVIAFETSTGKKVTHRVISISEKGMETKGDANDVSDGISTTHENFFGKTVFSVPYIGYGLVYLQQPKNAAIVAVILIAIAAYNFADSIFKRKKGEGRDCGKNNAEFFQ